MNYYKKIKQLKLDKFNKQKQQEVEMSNSLITFNSTNFMSKKIPLQTKYKKRGTNQSIHLNLQSLNASNQNLVSQQKINQIENHDNKSYNQEYNPQNNQFSRTSRFLSKANFSHHDNQNCVCKDCNCGRHHCKLNVIKPDFRKISTYKSNYKKNKSSFTPRIIQKQYSYTSRKVQMNSTYAFSFKDKITNIVEKHHPDDLLHFEGPFNNLTSYKTQFPGNKGSNPYVRPKQLFVGGNFPLKNQKTSYQNFYNPHNNVQKTQSGKINDQLKNGQFNCFNESFYQEKYKSPNPQDYAKKFKKQEKIEQNPSYSHQFGSTYLKDFVPIKRNLCPAKTKIQTQNRNFFDTSKINFNQNSDFKAMSSNYRALSLAPLGQY